MINFWSRKAQTNNRDKKMSIVADTLVFKLYNMSLMHENMSTGCQILKGFVQKYNQSYRLYVALSIILVGGVIGNIMNIIVFNRRSMKGPFTSILKALAWANLFSQLGRVPYTITINYYHKSIHDPEFYSLGGTFIIHQSIIFIFILIQWLFYMNVMCLTLTMSIWRWIAVTYPLKSMVWISPERTECAIRLSFIMSLIIFFYEIFLDFIAIYYDITVDETWDRLGLIPPFVLKIIVTATILIVSYRLLVSLTRARRDHRQLISNHQCTKRSQESIKTTSVSLVVMFLFVVHSFLIDFLELSILLDPTNYFYEHDCRGLLSCISQFLLTFDTSCDFFIYYTLNYKSFRQEIHSIFSITKRKFTGCILIMYNQCSSDSNVDRD